MTTKIHLIPGTMCNEKLWAAMLPFLDNSIEPVFLDIPMHKDFDSLVEYYAHLMEDNDLNLVGFSLGGYIATYFATRYSQRIAKLFVIGNSPTLLADEEIYQRTETLRLVSTYGYKGISRKRASMMLDRENQTETNIRAILAMDEDLGKEHLISQYQNTTERQDLAATICHLPCKVSFYYSEADRLVNSNWLYTLNKECPNISLLTTSGSGHMLPLEKPEELANLLNAWIQD